MSLDTPTAPGETTAQAPRLEVAHLSCVFDGREVVRDVSFRVAPGEIMCLLGPSGCGKSTTLRVIAGIERQSAGSVHADGKMLCNEVFSTPPEARGIGLIFQDFALFPHLTVGQNVSFGLRGPKARVQARVGELLERVDLVGYADKTPHMLSGGEQQRVALARALAPRPRIMLMDEPFSGLDNRLRDGIRDETLQLLKEEGTAVVLVTHEPEEAMRMADQIALMRDGQIVQKGAPYNIYNAPCDKAAAAFFSDINVIRGRVTGLLTDTVFGQFLAPGVGDGTEVEIVFRPQHVKLDFDRHGSGPNPTPQDGVPARGLVERARFMGHESLVEFRMDFDGGRLKATVPGVFLPKPGTPLWLSVRRDRCFVFPVTA
ncbi:Ferric iron ABC transporter, ATP-binding protein [Roseibacterium elongatum DSM 19469]|uniref:Ferric iron ABC transporter, ATP-binding protein n=1 Tax=Roseicyclus elongatus DSM 19469 TaxID=1294273 RepID=W8S1K3_9RHOB|nr:ABC transporter ATP-binding protein [Roseibacterium elongatum]AHM02611.1 Ferric iron ABC transporter, ATP-binding protein [Roseibacterium elongatum DSM 19469]